MEYHTPFLQDVDMVTPQPTEAVHPVGVDLLPLDKEEGEDDNNDDELHPCAEIIFPNFLVILRQFTTIFEPITANLGSSGGDVDVSDGACRARAPSHPRPSLMGTNGRHDGTSSLFCPRFLVIACNFGHNCKTSLGIYAILSYTFLSHKNFEQISATANFWSQLPKLSNDLDDDRGHVAAGRSRSLSLSLHLVDPATLTKPLSTSAPPAAGLIQQHLRCRKTFRLSSNGHFASPPVAPSHPLQPPSLLVMLSLSCFSELPPTLTLNSDSAGDLLTHSDRLLLQAQVRAKASDLLHQYISNITSSSQILKSSYIRKPYIHKVRARLVANSSPSKWYKPATAKIIPASIFDVSTSVPFDVVFGFCQPPDKYCPNGSQNSHITHSRFWYT
ncbi:hypothetical protein DFH07DRAFT_942716 [Mycena maculata]|uniref:Uncharacterized protein n=1 Tax=Mycena maculata TaxID=230809 RepID=A0AAD7IPB0_9AGAR|nr:hypothetical protein DFH07DRAFT_942716 [Mycena maculata]